MRRNAPFLKVYPIVTTSRFFRVLAGAAFLLTAADVRGQQKDEDRPLVTGIVLRGLKHLNREELMTGLATKASKCRSILYAPLCLFTRSPTFYQRNYLDPLELRRDVLRARLLYWRRGYRDAVVAARTERAGDGVRVVFDIDEKPPTTIERLDIVQIDSVLPKRVIDASVQVRAGQPLDLIAIDSSLNLLRDDLWERGYADAVVELDTTAVSDLLDTGPVTIRLVPGAVTRVKAIEVDGNRRVSDRTITRLMNLKEGSLFRRSDALASQRNLWLSGLFAEIDMQAVPPGDSQRVLKVRVAEADLQRVELGAGFTTFDYAQFDALFTRYNFIGGARRLTVRGTVANIGAAQFQGASMMYDVTNGATGPERDAFLKPTWSASVELMQPWFLSPRNQLGTSVFAHRRIVPGIVIDKGAGATIAFTNEFRPRSNSTVGYTFEVAQVEASDIYFCVNFGVCEPTMIDVLSARNRLAPVSWVTQFDFTNAPFWPNRGYRLTLDAEHASGATGSDFRYNRIALEASSYHRMGKQNVLAGRVRLGWVGALGGTSAALGVPTPLSGEIVHPRKRFYSGGSRSVRGFSENQLGPRVLTVSSLVLTDTSLARPCTGAELADGSCNPNAPGIPASDFHPRPLGGNSVAEGSVEYQFPIAMVNGLRGAVFVDGAVVRGGQFSNLIGATASVTPGFGLRFDTYVGPVRLDLGIRPTLVEQLPVVTDVTGPDGTERLVLLKTLRRYDPVQGSSGIRGILNRLMLHLAIGPAF